jgi:hypothetical protein
MQKQPGEYNCTVDEIKKKMAGAIHIKINMTSPFNLTLAQRLVKDGLDKLVQKQRQASAIPKKLL